MRAIPSWSLSSNSSARRIAIYTAEVRRVADSILAVQRLLDSARYAQVTREQAAQDAQRRHEDAAREEQRRREEAAALAAPYWGSSAQRMYFTNTPNCASLGFRLSTGGLKR